MFFNNFLFYFIVNFVYILNRYVMLCDYVGENKYFILGYLKIGLVCKKIIGNY